MFKTEFLDLPPLASIGGVVRLPGSKSISNRALLLSALSTGKTTLVDLLSSDDTWVMTEALRTLGCTVEQQGRETLVEGLGARARKQAAHLFLGNAGTAMRPLTAALAILGGDYELSGVPRMHERPIADLVNALRALGCQIDYLGQEGYPPLRIREPQLQLDKPIFVRGDVSSQFLTALLMALPLASSLPTVGDITIEVVGELISRPYIDITLSMLRQFGVLVRAEGAQRFVIPAGSQYHSPGRLLVEADASTASYFIAAGAIAAWKNTFNGLKIEGIGDASVQGDIRFVEAARLMGAQIEMQREHLLVRRDAWPLKAIDLDCNHIPDAAMTLAVMALYADGPSTLRNIASWRVKETDRLAAMATELRKLGAEVEELHDALRIYPLASPGCPGPAWRAASIHTYDDHRMAMCASLAAFNSAGIPVRIEDPQCVAKTFPNYFEALFSVSTPAPGALPVLCIDGPTASGKGTLASEVARRLGYHLLDSGALYRVTALAASRLNLALDTSQEATLAELARNLQLSFMNGRIRLEGEDVTDTIRSEAMGTSASLISTLPAVRVALLARQRDFAQLPGLVADGRDMGTVVFPSARLKVFLTANVTERARRRHEQLLAKKIDSKMDEVFADLAARDARDTTRVSAPLKPAEDALSLDNSGLTIEESVVQVLAWWQARQPF